MAVDIEPDWEEFERLGDWHAQQELAFEALEAREAVEAEAGQRLRIGNIEFSAGFSQAYYGLRDRWLGLVLLIVSIAVIVYLWEHA